MKKLEQMLAKMRPRIRHYDGGGSVANEPQQWTSQQKALMGRTQQKKGYNDIINDYHTPAGSAYRFTNPSAPIPFDAEKRFKQNVTQQQKVLEEQLINTEKAGERKAHNMVDQFQLKVLENQQRGIIPNQELMEKWSAELRNENQRQPYTGRYKLADERLQHQERSSYPPQLRMALNTQEASLRAEHQKDLGDMRKQQLGLRATIADTMKVPENERELPIMEQIQRHNERMNQKFGDNETKMQQTLKQIRAEHQAALGGYAGWKSPQALATEYVPKTTLASQYKPLTEYQALQTQYNALQPQLTTAQQQLAAKANLAYTAQQYQALQNSYSGYVAPYTYQQLQNQYNTLKEQQTPVKANPYSGWDIPSLKTLMTNINNGIVKLQPDGSWQGNGYYHNPMW